MKKKVCLIVFIVSLIMSANIYSQEDRDDDIVVEMTLGSLPDEDSDVWIEIPSRGNRMPALRIMCEISRENGITISQSGISENIVSYEVYDAYGCCVAIFSDEAGFIDFLFSGISGEYILRFKTDNRVYSGFISIK